MSNITEHKKRTKSLKQRDEYNSLADSERKIYDSIMRNFTNTSHDAAYDRAISGGVRWNFIMK